jgi:aryl-alcohol dehydrogenase-like predicted oxidoreductase
MLDHFVASGGRLVDAATNYPINGKPRDHGHSLKVLSSWVAANPASGIGILTKLGSVSNDGQPASRLSGRAIERESSRVLEMLGSSALGFAVHWDRRNSKTVDANRDMTSTLRAMRRLKHHGFQIGFSGVEDPAGYQRIAEDLSEHWWIQVKENVLDAKARLNCQRHFPKAKYFAYGINFGGLKSLTEPRPGSSVDIRKVRISRQEADLIIRRYSELGVAGPPGQPLTTLALRFAHMNSNLAGIVAGPSSVAQLKETLLTWSYLNGDLKSATL